MPRLLKITHILPTLLTRKIEFIGLIFTIYGNIVTFVGQKTAKMMRKN